MTILCLYGLNCDRSVWESLQPYFIEDECYIVEYPHELTQKAESITQLSAWVNEHYAKIHFDCILAHSMGGIIALELLANYAFPADQLIFIETNLRPANPFYRNLLTPDHMEKYGNRIVTMLQKEAPYYHPKIVKALQEDFDYQEYVRACPCPVIGIYGDRGNRHYEQRYSDLCLDEDILSRIQFCFIEDSAHMPMIENPQQLATIIKAYNKKQQD